MKKILLFLVLGLALLASQGAYASDLVDAIYNNDIAKVQELIKNGADVDALSDGSGGAALITAVTKNTEILKLLLDNGANPNLPAGGDSVLMIATAFGLTDSMELLLEKGANVNAQNSEGQTALFLCIYVPAGGAEAAKILLENGADINVKDKMGRTVLDFVTETTDVPESNRLEVIEYLKKQMK